MAELANLKCVACSQDAPQVTEKEIDVYGPQVPDWQVVEDDGIKRIERVFHFSDFASALEFTIHVGELAEVEEHHPAILTEWGRVKVSWWTHKIRGLHWNDFVAAAKTDQLFLTAGQAVTV